MTRRKIAMRIGAIASAAAAVIGSALIYDLAAQRLRPTRKTSEADEGEAHVEPIPTPSAR